MKLVAFVMTMLLLLCAVRGLARADEAMQRQHFKRGVEHYDKKRFEEALAAFHEAYKEKPSPIIKQNMGLTLKQLGRPAEAATAFDEALDEGRTTLTPENRAAIERELTELTKSVATINLALSTEDKKPTDGAIVYIDDPPDHKQARQVSGPALRRPIRLMPAVYVLTARLTGYPDPAEKKLALVSGAPIEVSFVFGAHGPGLLSVRASVPDAIIRLDGHEIGQGNARERVPPGMHRLEVTARGYRTTNVEVVVPAGGSIEYPVQMTRIGDPPPEVAGPGKPPPRQKHWYVVPALQLDITSYRLGVPLHEPGPSGKRRDFGGLSIGGRVGYQFWKPLAVEVLAELGGENAQYKLRPTDSTDTKTSAAHWQLGTALRLTLPKQSKVRFTTSAGIGFHGLTVETVPGDRTLATKKGQGIGYAFQADAGVQFDVGPVFLEAAVLFAMHNVEMIRTKDPGEPRVLYASPAVRGGLRIGVGIPF